MADLFVYGALGAVIGLLIWIAAILGEIKDKINK